MQNNKEQDKDFLLILSKEINKMQRNTKKLEVNCYEDVIDLEDMYTKEELEAGVEITQEEYEYYLNQETSKEPFATVEYGVEESYLAFNHYVWKELSTKEKILSILWFKELVEKDKRIEPLQVYYSTKIGEPAEVIIFNDNASLFINPRKFKSFDNDMEESYRTAYTVLMALLYKDLEVETKKALEGKESKKYSNLQLAGYANRIESTESYNNWVIEEPIDKEEEKQVALFGNQPMNMENKKVLELLNEYMLANEDVIKVDDDIWKMMYSSYLYQFERLDNLFKKHFRQDKDALYEKYFEESLSKIKQAQKENKIKKLANNQKETTDKNSAETENFDSSTGQNTNNEL